MTVTLDFAGKVAIVTGAGRGLGREYALALAARGVRVLVNDRGGSASGDGSSTTPADSVVDRIRAAGGEAAADSGDVVSEHADIVAAAHERWGRLDILVNNAGISGGGLLHEIDQADFDRVFDTHFRGTLGMLRSAWPLLADGGGRVVNTSSSSVFGMGGTSQYISAKAAIIGLTRAAAQEGEAVGVAVNAIMPTAYTRLTDQIPDEAFRDVLRSTFRPELVAPFVTWLCHDSATVTGELFAVAGGRVARVFLGEAPGVVLEEPTPEDYAGRLGRLMSVDGFTIPENAMAEAVATFAALAAPTDGVQGVDGSGWAPRTDA
ncbi:SDR family NAD(P)-dependent oxidoreductase [Rhodococcus olei]|uniref:SDR family NAD(P)-dependent oxidoreductase n=1 Tax=Rhodococcus olei TaxID=2161675 RepID=A0ABP8P610_9NOCA